MIDTIQAECFKIKTWDQQEIIDRPQAITQLFVEKFLASNKCDLIWSDHEVRVAFPEEKPDLEEPRSFGERSFVLDAKESFCSLKKSILTSSILA